MERLIQILRSLQSRVGAAVLRARGAKIDGHVWLRSVDVPRNAWDIRLADGVAPDRGVTLIATGERKAQPRIRIGRRCYANRFAIIDAPELIAIGDDCRVGPYCYLTDHDHDLDCGIEERKSRLVAIPTRFEKGV